MKAESTKIVVLLLCSFFLTLAVSAQEDSVLKERERIAQASDNRPVETGTPPRGPAETQKPVEKDDVADVQMYYQNVLEEYRLGPEDVITVRVFGQCPDYCRENLTIPPTARISYPLIRDPIFVAGKTIEQVDQEITRELNEFIIDPDVTIELVKVGSARYSVMGRVQSPGLHFMTRKVSILDAIAESGGITDKGDNRRAIIYRSGPDNKLVPIVVDLKDIQDGKTEMAYLSPGDQVYIPKEGFKLSDILDIAGRISVFRVLFGSPF